MSIAVDLSVLPVETSEELEVFSLLLLDENSLEGAYYSHKSLYIVHVHVHTMYDCTCTSRFINTSCNLSVNYF